MAVVLGTSAGFCAASPSADPAGSNSDMAGRARAFKDTSPATAVKVTELAYYNGYNVSSSNCKMGLYTHNSADDEPEELIYATGDVTTSGGWTKWTGLNISISPNTIYWIAMQVDTGDSHVDYTSDSERSALLTSQTTLTDPWGTSTGFSDARYAIVAVWEAATGTDMQVNIGDDWKAVESIQINVGDVWKSVAGAQINIGDDWKTIF